MTADKERGVLDLRLLESFVAIVDEGTISAAAESLHVSQPALSRRLRVLEAQVGQQLVHRSNKTATLTDAGARLRDKARTLLNLAAETMREVSAEGDDISGEIRIGAAESAAFRVIASVAKQLQDRHPAVRCSVHSGGGRAVEDGLSSGEFSFGLFIEPWDISRFETTQMPHPDRWGILVRRDSPLADSDSFALEALAGLDVVAPERVVTPTGVSSWLGSAPTMNLKGTYNLLYNAKLMVEEGVGVAIGIDGIVGRAPGDTVTFVPFEPSVTSRLHLAWLPGRRLTPAEQRFLELIRSRR
ncbi:LysR family transcriptional regulator [Gordonia pseudamarae]|uniref:LysR family transcriptional regulator n=1 Tax=Gordonia pseudamarae TaxID=2831662 RepID=A0ABX6II36_9ACTN|nr:MULTISPECIES: LysR family transcriptional regulator [Gordonia]MBD0023538.1 LysR family transcriptional regulator [Gordonia sp. (in: high G+C Gram-positive bacteria)]QHN26021.1 LysR family transcriptional regulator [Gordonia pseudamarae]QHN34945.1 LysR family transcriptional regulator [Gordonia pseudamarae]